MKEHRGCLFELLREQAGDCSSAVSFTTASLMPGFGAPDEFQEQLDICRQHLGNNLSLYVLNQDQHNIKEGI